MELNPVRNPVKKSKGKYPGYFPSLKMDRMVGVESTLERDQALLLDFDPAVRAFVEQPEEIDYRDGLKWRTYIQVLIPCHHAKGNRPHISPTLAEMIKEGISEIGLRRERTTVQSIRARVDEWLKEWNKRVLPGERLEMPSSKVFYRAVRHWDPFEIAVAKMGKEAADRHFRPAFKLPRPGYPLHIVQIDHSKVNLMTCVRGRVVVRRAWLTVALDQYTRMVVGLVIGYDPPGTKPVLAVLRNMILPKDSDHGRWCFWRQGRGKVFFT